MYDALYARQSVEKKDSISVESQLDYCRYETHGGAYREYTDRGYSGKSVARPGFERMMEDVARGQVRRVIVYKLDRISRSILDFTNMMEIFKRYHVEFISSTERFDTSTPIGRAMLNICIVFAQLERETIQKRVTDAYHARCRRGFYMGGRVPYGYRLRETVIDHVRTSMYEEVPEEGDQLRLIFSMYADRSYSLGDIVRYLEEHQIRHLRGGEWNTARLSEMIRNPVYVKADMDVYQFFKSQGAIVLDPIGDFTGKNGCYLYKSADTDVRRGSLAGREVILAPHEGIIPSGTWIACRRRCLAGHPSTVGRRAKNSWLTGKVRCGNCGHTLTIRRSRAKWGRYFVCSRSGRGCKGTGGTVYADVLEEYIQQAVGQELSEYPVLYMEENGGTSQQEDGMRMRLIRVGEEIRALIEKVTDADEVLMGYISEKIRELDAERGRLQEEINAVSADKKLQITEHARMWGEVSFEDRREILDILIETIRIADGQMKICWRV